MKPDLIYLRCPKNDNVYYTLPNSEVETAWNSGARFEIRLPDEKNPETAPLIAVILGLDNGEYAVDKNMINALQEAGARLTFIHYEDVDAQLEQIRPDGFLLPGGCFDSPADFYRNSELLDADHEVSPRSLAYVYAIDYANENKVPMLGICAGFQMIAGMSGAKMYVNLARELPGSLKHKEDKNLIAHAVKLDPQSALSEISQKAELDVNSVHSEGVINDDAALEGLKIVAWSSDNVAEAVEGGKERFVMGVQWHPEYLYKKDPSARAVFEALIKAAAEYKEKNNDY